MGAWADRIIAGVRDRIENECDAFGVELTADVRQAISTPVIRGPNGNVVQRSPPFADPWLETGHLWRSQGHDVFSGATFVQLNIWNTAYYARALNAGHDGIAPRPFWGHVEAAVPALRSRVAAAIVGKR